MKNFNKFLFLNYWNRLFILLIFLKIVAIATRTSLNKLISPRYLIFIFRLNLNKINYKIKFLWIKITSIRLVQKIRNKSNHSKSCILDILLFPIKLDSLCFQKKIHSRLLCFIQIDIRLLRFISRGVFIIKTLNIMIENSIWKNFIFSYSYTFFMLEKVFFSKLQHFKLIHQ